MQVYIVEYMSRFRYRIDPIFCWQVNTNMQNQIRQFDRAFTVEQSVFIFLPFWYRVKFIYVVKLFFFCFSFFLCVEFWDNLQQGYGWYGVFFFGGG